MHPNEADLRAFLDREMEPTAQHRVQTHLESCPQCQLQVQALQDRAERVYTRLAQLAPPEQSKQSVRSAPLSPLAAQQRLRRRLSETPEKEISTMLNKLFTRSMRPLWVGLTVITILAVSMAFPSVRAIANSFLGLFRVQQIAIVPVNPGDLGEQLGRSSELSSIMAESMQVDEAGEPVEVASAAEAADLYGAPVRLPAAAAGDPKLTVTPGGQATFNVDLERIKALLAELGHSDVDLPAVLDGSQVKINMSPAVVARYGDCQDVEFDPDEPHMARQQNCTTLMQMPSPTVEAPEGLDLRQVGEAYLQVMGMSEAEAARFSETVDWTTTLVVPLPLNGTSYEEVTVDGVPGTLINQTFESGATNQMLIWVKNGIIYALASPYSNPAAVIELANSIR